MEIINKQMKKITNKYAMQRNERKEMILMDT